MSKPSKPASTMDMAILGLLMNGDVHGYELKKKLGELPGSAISVSFGSLYPALARLERNGSVEAVRTLGLSNPTSPMTGALSGELAAFRTAASVVDNDVLAKASRERGRRGKKVYRITDGGRDRLVGLLLNESDDDRAFNLRVAFARHLEPQQRKLMFETRRHQLTGRLRDLTERTTPRSSDPFLSSLEEHDITTLNSTITWLDTLLERTAVEPFGTTVLNSTTGGTRQ